jgi:hypothetical protein
VAKHAWLVGALALLVACNPDDVVHKVGWFATMRHQRNIKPYARPIPPVPGTVPVTATELPVTRENADRLSNPRTRTAESATASAGAGMALWRSPAAGRSPACPRWSIRRGRG